MSGGSSAKKKVGDDENGNVDSKEKYAGMKRTAPSLNDVADKMANQMAGAGGGGGGGSGSVSASAAASPLSKQIMSGSAVVSSVESSLIRKEKNTNMPQQLQTRNALIKMDIAKYRMAALDTAAKNFGSAAGHPLFPLPAVNGDAYDVKKGDLLFREYALVLDSNGRFVKTKQPRPELFSSFAGLPPLTVVEFDSVAMSDKIIGTQSMLSVESNSIAGQVGGTTDLPVAGDGVEVGQYLQWDLPRMVADPSTNQLRPSVSIHGQPSEKIMAYVRPYTPHEKEYASMADAVHAVHCGRRQNTGDKNADSWAAAQRKLAATVFLLTVSSSAEGLKEMGKDQREGILTAFCDIENLSYEYSPPNPAKLRASILAKIKELSKTAAPSFSAAVVGGQGIPNDVNVENFAFCYMLYALELQVRIASNLEKANKRKIIAKALDNGRNQFVHCQLIPNAGV